MTQPYRYRDYQLQYICPSDEAALLVRLRQRRAGISTISWKPRSIYGARKTPFADHIVLTLYEWHREDRISTC